MPKNKNHFVAAFVAILFFTSCLNSYNSKSKETIKNKNSEYEHALSSTDSLRNAWRIDEVKIEIDLNDDGKKEEFIAISGCSAGYFYSLFTNENGNWKLISEKEEIPNGTAPSVSVLKETHKGWHDFSTFQGSRNQSINEFTYTWNGTIYVLKIENQQRID